MKHEVRLPDIEVIVRCADWDVAVIAFWGDKDIHKGFHVVTGIDERSNTANVVAALREAIAAIERSDWHSLDELGAAADEDGTGEPF